MYIYIYIIQYDYVIVCYIIVYNTKCYTTVRHCAQVGAGPVGLPYGRQSLETSAPCPHADGFSFEQKPVEGGRRSGSRLPVGYPGPPQAFR